MFEGEYNMKKHKECKYRHGSNAAGSSRRCMQLSSVMHKIIKTQPFSAAC